MRTPATGVWYRAVQTQYLNTALSVQHSTTLSSRFSAAAQSNPKYELLYLAEDHNVALFEVGSLLGSPSLPGAIVPNPRVSWTNLNVTISLSSIANLTTAASQALLSTSAQELTGDWDGYQTRGTTPGSVTQPVGIAPTQELGDALFNVPGLEGFRTISARVPWSQSLVLFPQKLQPGSFVEWQNPLSGVLERLP